MGDLLVVVVLGVGSLVCIVWGYDVGTNRLAKSWGNKKALAIAMAKADIASYLMTILPLALAIVSLTILDPLFTASIEHVSTNMQLLASYVPQGILLVAGFGVGLGVARRRYTLLVARS